MACIGFQPSNVRDEPIIISCCDIERKDGNIKLIEANTEIVVYLNSDRGDLLIRGYRDRNTACIIDVRICDVNQLSYLTRKPVSIVKSVRHERKRSILTTA